MSQETPVYLAIDLGASSGRVMAGYLEDAQLKLKEIHRFASSSTHLPSGYHWDIQDIYRSILRGLSKAGEIYGNRIESVGVDAWGVDYALLDKNNRLLGDPYQYRDPRGEQMGQSVLEKLGKKTIYEETGIQFLFFNSLYQLAAEQQAEPGRLELAHSLLFLPDLIGFWLSGVRVQERSIASTSQLWNPVSYSWSETLIRDMDFPERLFQPVTEPGTVLGPLLPEVQDATGLGPVTVVAVAGHDTGSAVAGSPLSYEAPVFLSSGTWSIMGIEIPEPIINEEALRESFSNEAGVGGTTRFLKNICGMWLIEQLREQWSKEGSDYSYENLLDMAAEAQPFGAIIDPDDSRFASPGNMSDRMREYCRETGQTLPQTKGELMRSAFESLACKYFIVFEKLETLAGEGFGVLRIVGGGCQNSFLNQCTADALGRPVIAGPVEATSLGNILLQMVATKFMPDLAAGRRMVHDSFEKRVYEPRAGEAWKEPIERLKTNIEHLKEAN